MLKHPYGITVPEGAKEADVELLMAFNARCKDAIRWDNGQPGFQGTYYHMRRAVDYLWNVKTQGTAYYWNDWTEQMQEGFCENKWVTVTGPGASWKTTSAAVYVLTRWYASPHNTIVVLTSTTLPGLRRRIWKEITKYYRFNQSFGNLVPSQNCIQFTNGDDNAGLFGVAVDEGDIQKAVGKIMGFHNTNVIVVVDEMQTVNEAIVEACVNLESGSDHFQFIGLGNAEDELDPHGRMCEPLDGWGSITPEHQEWKTKRGICIHLDGLESPNIKAGFDKFPGLLKQRDIDSTIEYYGEDSPQFWSQRRGFWPPQGIRNTVLSSALITKFKAKEKAVWLTEPRKGAALDPAFEGGDRCALRIGKCGTLQDGTIVMTPGDKIIIKPNASDPEPIHYQIATKVKELCEDKGIGVEMFAMDTTGEGGGLASIISKVWSPGFLEVEFGGAASDLAVSSNNPKKAREEYVNRVTELWYSFRVALLNGQVRELDDDTAVEFTKRQYEMRGKMIVLETKAKMKERLKKSPDLADACSVLCELFRRRGGLQTSPLGTQSSNDSWSRLAKQMDVASDPQNYLVSAYD